MTNDFWGITKRNHAIVYKNEKNKWYCCTGDCAWYEASFEKMRKHLLKHKKEGVRMVRSLEKFFKIED